MADAYTDTTALANLVADGYDKVVNPPLRAQLVFRQFVDKHPVALTNVGKTVTLSIVKDIASDATTPLSEDVDVDATAMPDPDQVSVTVNEYGFAEVTTLKLRQLNFAQGGVDPIIADVLVRHMAKSLDSLVRSVTDGATNVIGKNAGTLATNNSGTPFAVNSVAATDKLDSATVLGAVTLLRGRNALGRDGADNFVGLIHPDVAADIMTDTGWLSPHQYRDTTQLYNAEIGSYLGARFVTSNRCSSAANSGSVKVYNTYFLGRQALVEATIADAHVVVGPQVDKLRRFNPLGWLYHGGWSIFREDCIEIAKTASSLSDLS